MEMEMGRRGRDEMQHGNWKDNDTNSSSDSSDSHDVWLMCLVSGSLGVGVGVGVGVGLGVGVGAKFDEALLLGLLIAWSALVGFRGRIMMVSILLFTSVIL